MRVRATQRGYYGGRVREPGEEFSLAKDEDFSSKWMVETEASKRTRSETDTEAKADDEQPDDNNGSGSEDSEAAPPKEKPKKSSKTK
jgi:hypothetical protein